MPASATIFVVSIDRTLSTQIRQVPIRSLLIEVLAGPDKGRSFQTEEDVVSIGTAEGNGLVLTDDSVSPYHVELHRSTMGTVVRDLGSTHGVRVGRVQIHRGVIAPDTLLDIGGTRLCVRDGSPVEQDVHSAGSLAGVLGHSPAMRHLMARMARAAHAEVPVLLDGESGTGKSLIGRAIHEMSNRSARPFVYVDCGALPVSVIASELFGHERGAFTGADQKREGAFERAEGGTLMLDEIGELPLAAQPTLLGALQRKQIRRVGGTRDINTDVRVIAATNRELRGEVNRGTFRLDLYYRLAVLRMTVPPLRSRQRDIPLLVEHFLRAAGYAEAVSEIVPDEIMDQWLRHPWPGNVRELRNAVESTLVLREAPDLFTDMQLPAPVADDLAESDPFAEFYGHPIREAREEALGRFERAYSIALIERNGGNVSQAAREGQLDRKYLHELLKRHGA